MRSFHVHTRPISAQGGFTLIELLVVVAIIALLVSILIPSLNRARISARKVVCLANLKEIGVANAIYADQNDEYLPDRISLGGYGFRMAPGQRTRNDPSAFPEIFGWAALLQKVVGVPADSPVWVCPGQRESMTQFANTYEFTITLDKRVSKYKNFGSQAGGKANSLPTNHVIWDNVTRRPYLSGFRSASNNPPGYAIPTTEQYLPHVEPGRSALAINGAAFFDYTWRRPGNVDPPYVP